MKITIRTDSDTKEHLRTVFNRFGIMARVNDPFFNELLFIQSAGSFNGSIKSID